MSVEDVSRAVARGMWLLLLCTFAVLATAWRVAAPGNRVRWRLAFALGALLWSYHVLLVVHGHDPFTYAMGCAGGVVCVVTAWRLALSPDTTEALPLARPVAIRTASVVAYWSVFATALAVLLDVGSATD